VPSGLRTILHRYPRALASGVSGKGRKSRTIGKGPNIDTDRRGAPAALRGDDARAGTPSSRAASALLSNAAAPAWSWSRPRIAIALSAGRSAWFVYPRLRLAAFPHRRWAPRRPRSQDRHLHPAARDVALRRAGLSPGRHAALRDGVVPARTEFYADHDRPQTTWLRSCSSPRQRRAALDEDGHCCFAAAL
jgi:hypothetical protein